MSWWNPIEWAEAVVDFVGDVVEVVADVVVDAFFPSYEQETPDTPNFEAANRGIMLNKVGHNEPIPVIYGQRKVGGIKVLKTTAGGDNSDLYIVLIISEGEIESFENIWIDDILSTDSRFSGKLTINEQLGTDGQAADSMLVAAGIGWTEADTLSGLAYLACKFTYDTGTYRREPVITTEVKGRKVLDVRTSTTAWSDNPPLCTYDYLTNTRYGKGLDTSLLDTTSFQDRADDADVLVTPYSGGTDQKKFTCNAVIDTGQTVMSNTRTLLSGMLGGLPYRDGKYYLTIEDTGASVFSFTEDNMLQNWTYKGSSKDDRYNRVIATYVNPDASWQTDQVSFPEAGSADYTAALAEDNGFVREREVTLATVTDVYRARHIAEVFYQRSRYGLKATFGAPIEALQLSVGDIVDITHSSPGWTAKLFRVTGLTLKPDALVSVSVIEHQDAIYPYSAGAEEDPSPPTNLPDPHVVGVPGAPSVVETLYTTTQSSGVKAKATVSWAASADAFVETYQIEYKLSADSTWIEATPVSAPTVTLDIFDIPPGTYDFRVKAINQMGAPSEYAANPTQEITGLGAPPSAPGNLTISSLGGLAVLRWDQAADLDVKIGGRVIFRHSNAQSGATWQTSVSIGEAVPGVATETVLPLKPGTYLAKFEDSSGIPSTSAASVPTKGANVIAFSSLSTLQEDTAFSGTHTDTINDGGTLKLAGDGEFDDVADVDAITDWDFGEGVATSGIYDFATGFDLGSVKTVKLETTVAVTVTAALDNIDARATNCDDWEDWDGNAAGAGDLQVWVRETDDDPAGAPTWSDWQRLDAAEYTARGFDFQARLTTDDSSYNINISQLRVEAMEVA